MIEVTSYKLRLPARFCFFLSGSGVYYDEPGNDPILVDLVQGIVNQWGGSKPVTVEIPRGLVDEFYTFATVMKPDSIPASQWDPDGWADAMGDKRAGDSVLRQIRKTDQQLDIRRDWRGVEVA